MTAPRATAPLPDDDPSPEGFGPQGELHVRLPGAAIEFHDKALLMTRALGLVARDKHLKGDAHAETRVLPALLR